MSVESKRGREVEARAGWRARGSKTRALFASLVLLAAVSVGACGNDAVGDGNVAGGTSGGSSPSMSGSGGTGTSGSGVVAGSGGSSGSSGSATELVGHCAPGELLAESKSWNQKLTQCPLYDAAEGGIPDDPYLQVRQLNLPTAMTANEDYALSIEVAFAMAGMHIVLWGTSSSCGKAEQKLYEGPMTKGTLCATMKPNAPYPAVLIVWRGGEANGRVSDMVACADGTCPAL